MIAVIIPIVLLFLIIMLKRLPVIGGKVYFALIIASLATLILGRVYSPIEWAKAWINGLDRLAWVMALSLAGSFYGETQGAIGALDTVVDLFRALFGKSARGMVVAVIIAIAVAGEAFGDAIGAASVVGLLVIPALAGMGMKPERVAGTILFGVLIGSIMPPISQAVALSASILGVGAEIADKAINITFITCGITMIVITAYAAFVFVENKPIAPELIPKDSPAAIIKKGWIGLLPLALIAVLIILNSTFGINVMKNLLGPVFPVLADTLIVKGFTNTIVMILIAASIITIVSKNVRDNFGKILKDGVKNVIPSLTVQACAAFFVGAILAGGQIDVVIDFTKHLNDNLVKIGGGVSLLVVGMVTGSQTSAQNIIFTFFGPLLVNMGVSSVNATIVGSHLASAGQALPPANVTALVVAAMVGSNLGKKVDPVSTMIVILPMTICLAIIGFLFMFI
jgi:TRAP-type C4-dicarboxylate transport system permease large subunit